MTHSDTQPADLAAIGPPPDELGAIIDAYERALPDGERYTLDVSPLDRLGMPVIFDVIVADGLWVDGYGYGGSREESRVGALGELSEVLHTTRALAHDPGIPASFDEMVRKYGAERVMDPRALALPAGSKWSPAQPMRWMRVQRWPEGEAFVPREFVAPNPSAYRAAGPLPDPVVTPITNGLGAGGTLEQALSHGVLELLQRDGNATRFRAMDRGVVIDLAAVEDPGILALLQRLRSAGVAPLAKLASTEFGLVNLYVVDGGDDDPPFGLQVTACGEAAHANAERALRKALLEFAAARSRKAMAHGPLEPIAALAPDDYLEAAFAGKDPAAEEPRALAAMTEWVKCSGSELRAKMAGTVLAERSRVELARLPSVPDRAVRDPVDRLADLAGRLGGEGLEILYYDATPAGGPSVVKAIVPRLECETMSYHRIGPRGVARLAAEPAPSGRILASYGGPPPPGAAPVLLTPEDAERIGPAWLDVAAVDDEVGALYPLYREPSNHSVRIALRRGSAGRRS